MRVLVTGASSCRRGRVFVGPPGMRLESGSAARLSAISCEPCLSWRGPRVNAVSDRLLGRSVIAGAPAWFHSGAVYWRAWG